ncbi:MAG: hypothetical protein WDN46_24090 [Methylocella sp.]
MNYIKAKNIKAHDVKVFNVNVFDGMTSENLISSRMSEAEAREWTIIEGSMVAIDESELEPGEQWTPRGFEPKR